MNIINRADSGWISVNKKLPEYGKGVLLFLTNGAMTIGYLKASTLKSIYREWQLFGEMNDTLCLSDTDSVTHWRPLPQPPSQSSNK